MRPGVQSVRSDLGLRRRSRDVYNAHDHHGAHAQRPAADFVGAICARPGGLRPRPLIRLGHPLGSPSIASEPPYRGPSRWTIGFGPFFGPGRAIRAIVLTGARGRAFGRYPSGRA